MIKEINIGNPKTALKALYKLRNNKTDMPVDIKILNSHITEINKLVGIRLFKNSILYINSETIWELMQKQGGKKSHNYHGLTPEDIYMAFASIKNPRYVFVAFMNRIATITVELSHFNKPLMILIEPNSGLTVDTNAGVNKIVSIYPKEDVDNYVKRRWEDTILYKKSNL